MSIVDRFEGWSRPSTPLVFKCHDHLSECTIRLKCVSFLITIAFRRVGKIRGPINGIKVEVTGWNPGVSLEGEIVDRSKG